MKRPAPNRGLFLIRSPALKEAWPRMSPREQLQVADMHRFYQVEFRKHLNHQPEGTAASLHDVVDGAVQELMKKPRADEVSCRKGCAHCCHLNVDVTVQEAQLLLYAAQVAGFEFDEARAQRQAAAPSWGVLDPADRACVFLGADGACAVYEHRPMACRKYFVLTPAENCDSVKNPGLKVLHFVSMEAEIFSSAAFTVFGCEPLPRQLKRAAEANEKRTDCT
jgi:Fe-S-cluster containining protein